MYTKWQNSESIDTQTVARFLHTFQEFSVCLCESYGCCTQPNPITGTGLAIKGAYEDVNPRTIVGLILRNKLRLILTFKTASLKRGIKMSVGFKGQWLVY